MKPSQAKLHEPDSFARLGRGFASVESPLHNLALPDTALIHRALKEAPVGLKFDLDKMSQST